MRDKQVSRHWARYQPILFGSPDPDLFLAEPLQKLIVILDTIGPEMFWTLHSQQLTGRRNIDRFAMMRVFVGKAVLNIPDNIWMRERLLIDYTLRRICGFTDVLSIPCEATFSNVFKEFSDSGLVAEMHEDLICGYVGDVLLEHVSRDATAIPARKKASEKQTTVPDNPKKRGRPKKG